MGISWENCLVVQAGKQLQAGIQADSMPTGYNLLRHLKTGSRAAPVEARESQLNKKKDRQYNTDTLAETFCKFFN